MNKEITEEEKDKATCWICYEWMESPITLPCSHSFCQACIAKVYRKNQNCAYCRRPIQLPLPSVNEELDLFVSKIRNESEQSVKKLTFSSPKEQDSEFLDLPFDVLSDVIINLDPKDIASLARTCTLMHDICNDNWIWREKTLSSFPFHSVKEGYNWKLIYRQRMKTQRGWTEGKSGDFKVTSMRDHKKYISCIDIFKRNIITGSADSKICLWRMNSKSSIYTLTDHTAKINAVRINGSYVISGSDDKTSNVWDATTGTHIGKYDHNDSVKQVEFQRNGFISASDCLKIYDIRQQEDPKQFCTVENIKKFKFIDDNHLVVYFNNGIKLWDLRYISQSLCDINERYLDIDADRDGFYAISGSKVVMYDINGAIRLTKQDGELHDLRNIQVYDDQLILSSNNKYYVLDKQTFSIKHKIEKGNNYSINSFCCDKKMIVGGMSDNSIRVHNIETEKQMYLLLGGSVQAKKPEQEHPEKKGCSNVIFDETRIIGTFGHILKVYQFGG